MVALCAAGHKDTDAIHALKRMMYESDYNSGQGEARRGWAGRGMARRGKARFFIMTRKEGETDA